MQDFIDTATQQPWAFDDDVIVKSADGVFSFADSRGISLSVPTTLQPYTQPQLTAEQIATEKAENAWALLQGQAKAALDQADITILRCYENNVAVPAGWATYRKDLRAIISARTGDATQPLPEKPAYPVGT